MRCTHGLPYEIKCQRCINEALARVITQPQSPPKDATPEQTAEFWKRSYTNTHPNN